jgi:hypothetical protein
MVVIVSIDLWASRMYISIVQGSGGSSREFEMEEWREKPIVRICQHRQRQDAVWFEHFSTQLDLRTISDENNSINQR